MLLYSFSIVAIVHFILSCFTYIVYLPPQIINSKNTPLLLTLNPSVITIFVIDNKLHCGHS